MKSNKNISEDDVDFKLPAIIFSFVIFGIIGHFTTYSFLSKYLGDHAVLIFLINGVVAESLWLTILGLRKYFKNNPQIKGLGGIFKSVRFIEKPIVILFKIIGYILDRLALVLGTWVFIGALVTIAMGDSGGFSGPSMVISGILVIGFFVFRYFTNDDHSKIW